MAPSTIVSGGTGSIPKFRSWKDPPLPFFTWVSLTALDPRSRPMQFFAMFRVPTFPSGAAYGGARSVFFGVPEHHHAITGLQAHRLEDFPFRVHPAGHPTLDPVHREGRETGSSRELGLAHH